MIRYLRVMFSRVKRKVTVWVSGPIVTQPAYILFIPVKESMIPMTRKELWVFEKVESVNAHKSLRLKVLIGSQLWWLLGSFPANCLVAHFFFLLQRLFSFLEFHLLSNSLESRWKSILFGQLSTYLFVKQPLEKPKKKKKKEIPQLNDLVFQHLVLLIFVSLLPLLKHWLTDSVAFTWKPMWVRFSPVNFIY